MQTLRRRAYWTLVLAGATLVAGYIGYLAGLNRWPRPSEPSFIRPSEQAIVDKALHVYGHGKVSRAALLNSYDINVVYLPTMTCVGFNILPPAAGGDDTLCFNKSDQRVILTYRDGE